MKTFGFATLAFLMLAGGCAASATNGDSSGNTNDVTGDAVAGKTLFADNCANCHSASSLSGYSATNLTGVIQDGTGGMDPQSQLSDQDVADIVAYLTSL